jgi:hypothetical protein
MSVSNVGGSGPLAGPRMRCQRQLVVWGALAACDGLVEFMATAWTISHKYR